MPRTQMPIKPIQVDYICDDCGKGNMRPTGVMQMTEPPKFPHKCTNCEKQQTFSEKYPTVRYTKEGGMLDLGNYQQQTL